jgi:hypothetical protein
MQEQTHLLYNQIIAGRSPFDKQLNDLQLRRHQSRRERDHAIPKTPFTLSVASNANPL